MPNRVLYFLLSATVLRPIETIRCRCWSWDGRKPECDFSPIASLPDGADTIDVECFVNGSGTDPPGTAPRVSKWSHVHKLHAGDPDCFHFVFAASPPFALFFGVNDRDLDLEDDNYQLNMDGGDTLSGCLTRRSKPHSRNQHFSIHVINRLGYDSRSVVDDSASLLPEQSTAGKVLQSYLEPVKEKIGKKSSTDFLDVLKVISLFLSIVLILGAITKKVHNMKREGMRELRFGFRRLQSDPSIPKFTENVCYEPTESIQEHCSVRVIRRKRIVFKETIAEGNFGKVYLGELLSKSGNTQVAVKLVKRQEPNDVRGSQYEIRREAALLSLLNHPNIVQFKGICLSSQPNYLVFEYMENGDLNSFLRSHAPGCEVMNDEPRITRLTLIDIASQISKGLQYIASRKLVHRDLATRNCLVSGRGEDSTEVIVKIGDFGMSRNVSTDDYYTVGKSAMLPVRWMSPEAILYHRFSAESDVFSLGVLFWEIFTFGVQPWYSLDNAEVIEAVTTGKRLAKPIACPDEMYHLMTECWAEPPRDRISITSVCHRLATLLPLHAGDSYLPKPGVLDTHI